MLCDEIGYFESEMRILIVLLFNREIQMKRIVELTDENCSFRNKHMFLCLLHSFVS